MDIAVIIGEVAYISRERILDGIIDAARDDGANIILFTSEGFLFHEMKEFSSGEYNIYKLPFIENYDGVIIELDSISNPKIQQYLTDTIIESKVPCVSINRELGESNVINFENESGFRTLISHLVTEHKFTNFHYLSGPLSNRDAVERLDIFKSTLASHEIKFKDKYVIEGDFSFDSGKKLAYQYISGERKLPEAVVCANDFMAIGLMEELKSNGIRVPEDVAITGYDNSSIAAYTIPRLTTVDRGEYKAGGLAYKKLVSNINETEFGTCDIIEGEAVIAGTCGCKMDEESHKKYESQSAVELKVNMDDSLDLLKGLTLGFANMNKVSDFQHNLEKYIKKIGMESFYFCQCGSRESYYEELEVMAAGKRVRRNMSVYQDTVWCPFAYESGEWNSYPAFNKRKLFPPGAKKKKEGGYYIVMPVHQGDICIGFSIIGNFHKRISGRVLQHLVLGIDTALGHIRKSDIMSTMLAKINQKWQFDELTGLYNRSGFVNNAEKLIEKAESEDKGICVTFFDLDGLKSVNDTKGHEAGDAYIKSMADMLRECTDESDVVCRYGGDEFVVLSIQNSLEESTERLAVLQEGIKPPVSASAGCVFDVVSSMDELSRLIEEADKRMYLYKKEKKRCR
ncbi:MAG: GGDEF domain-containing protein [Oscillospiraceae bacterium]|nr:GGDEF domain-containing protein [Oscillospiraceae bacterium]